MQKSRGVTLDLGPGWDASPKRTPTTRVRKYKIDVKRWGRVQTTGQLILEMQVLHTKRPRQNCRKNMGFSRQMAPNMEMARAPNTEAWRLPSGPATPHRHS